MKRKDGFLARGPDWATLGQQGTVVWGPRGGEKGSSTTSWLDSVGWLAGQWSQVKRDFKV